MRFKLQVQFQGEPPFIMPANYQYELSECINKILHFNNVKFIQKLEESGYLDEHRQFKFFNFSNIDINDYEQDNDRLIIENSHANMSISILANDSIKKDIEDLFTGKELRFGDKKNKVTIKIKSVEPEPEPSYSDSMDLRVVTPLVISNNEVSNTLNKNTKYLSPEDKDYERLFFKILMSKYALLVKSVKDGYTSPINSNFSQLKFNCTSKAESRIVRVKTGNNKTISVKGYLFDFNITAPQELIKLGYHSGFGELNNLGFGWCIIR